MIIRCLMIGLTTMYFSIKVFCQQSQEDSCKVIKVTSYKYDYLITAINLSNNDTISIISDKTKTKKKGYMISVGGIYFFTLTPLLDITKTSAMPPNCFRLRAKDKRTLWANGQDIKLIPYKAENLKGLTVIE